MFTCTLAVGPGIVAVGVPSKATKSRKTAPSLQLGSLSASSMRMVTESPAWNVTVLSPMTMLPAGAPPKPVGTSVVADTVTFAAVIAGIAAPAGDANNPKLVASPASRAERGDASETSAAARCSSFSPLGGG